MFRFAQYGTDEHPLSQRTLSISMLLPTVRFGSLCGTLVYLPLLLLAVSGSAFAGQTQVPSQPVPVVPGPPPSPQERILSPIPTQFDWMRREVRPNRPLESLLGLQVGPPQLLMSVSLAEEYSDNFFLSERERRDEYRTSLDIGTVYRLESGPSFVSLANSISANYDARSERSHFGFANLSLNAGHRLPGLSLALNESFIRSDNVEEASPLGIRRERRTFLSNTVSPQVRYDLTRTTAVNLAYTNTLVRNEHGGRDGTDILLQDGGREQGDSISHSFTSGLQHWFSRNLSSNVSYTFTATDNTAAADTRTHAPSADLDYIFGPRTIASLRAFDTITDRSDGGIDSQIYGASVGLRQRLTSFLTGFVSIGPTVFDRENRGLRTFVNWQVSLDGALPITRQISLTLSGQRSVDSTVGEIDDVGIVLTQSARLTLTHTISRDLLTSLFFDYTRTELLEDVGTRESVQGRKDNFWSPGARITYALTRIFSLSVSYRYQRHDSNLPGADFDENRVTVALSTTFPVF